MFHMKAFTTYIIEFVTFDSILINCIKVLINFCFRNPKKASFIPALFKTFGGMFLVGAFYRLVNDLLIFVNPNILG